ncbi:hypothetical protein [Reinekea sp. G2M2-21]|uniref:hypothetical protein n=1 Tax=Reinekea sp. G2M2-21 TaxID=2788942 RepID=UPI0018A8C731|nr:hypothetical protein [Reinekea sp. G2M2-21]
MEIEYAKEYGETPLDNAYDMLWVRSTCGCNHAEFIFVRFSEHLTEHPDLKTWFLDELKVTLSKDWLHLAKETKRPAGFIPSELADYIAHVTRWPEFKKWPLMN